MFKLVSFILFLCSFSVFGQAHLSMSMGAKKAIPLMGYNANMAHAPSWKNADFTNALNKLNPKILRYPGGSNSFYWDWKKGWTKSYEDFHPYLKSSQFLHKGKPINSPKELKEIASNNKAEDPFWRQLNRYNAKRPKYNTITDFNHGLKQTESDAIFCLNLISSSISNEIAMLKKASAEGIPVKYIELGNELNGSSLLSKHFYPTTQSYVDTCLKWAEEIWKIFPHAEIGLIGGDKRAKDWNEKLTSAFQTTFPNKKNQLSFILHYYTHFKKPSYNLSLSNEYKQFIGLTQLDISKKLNHWNWNETKDFTTWVTEYNVIEKKPHEINNSWAHGLFISNQIHQLLHQTKATIFNFHNIGSDAFPGFAALDLINKDERYLQATAAGVVTSLWNKLTADAENLYNINLNNQLWKVYYPSKHTCDCPNNPQTPTTIELNPIHAYKSMRFNLFVFSC